ncbi:MAG: HAD family phosphatase [Hymenobacter sp.]|nr:MAG: HAD family phosphatase [Hymenobacter sp.]
MPELKALIFDMDGVLIDNTAYQARAFQALFLDLGLTTNARRLLRRLNGMPATAILQAVFRHEVPEEELEEYASQREFLFRTSYRSHRKPLAGLVHFLETARAAGFKVGLGTGSINLTLSYIIDYLDLRRHFDVVIGADDVDKGKPHGETYETVAEKLGVKPENCVVFEDAILGEQAAYRAGMQCVAVGTFLKTRDFQHPLAFIRDFTELTPERLRELFSERAEVPEPNKELANREYAKQQ